jgi:glycosyltransferase involved in cell wall biosynthesis
MDQNWLVSIIINNFNYGRFLPAAINSALWQSHPLTEVIVVDDGSTDNSREIIAGYEDRVIPVLTDNGGQAAAFNAGFAKSTGDIVIFLDADDELRPHTAALVVEQFTQDPTLAKVQYRLAVIDAFGRETGKYVPPEHLPMPNGDLRRHMLAFPDDVRFPPTSGNAFRASVLRQIFPVPEADYGRTLADLYLLALTPLFGPVASLDTIGAYYRVHGDNFHYQPSINLERIWEILLRTYHGHRFITQYAEKLELPDAPQDASDILSVTFIANRFVSHNLAPNLHPISGDSRIRLLTLGLRATRRRFDVRPAIKVLYALWFLAMAVSPKSFSRWLGERIFFTQPGSRVARLLSTPRAASGATQNSNDNQRRLRSITSSGPILLALCALLLWFVSLVYVDVYRMNDLGLISVLPVSFFISVLLLTGSFCLALRQRPVKESLMLLHVGILIVILYSTTALVNEVTRFGSTWLRVGNTDYIVQQGAINPRIDAFFNWPGFYGLTALLTETAGLDNLIDLAAWSPVFYNALYILPLVVILQSLTRDRRVVWLAVWLFLVTNWVGQDYFSPQGFVFFLYLVALAVLLKWFRSPSPQPLVLSSILRRLGSRFPRIGWLHSNLIRPDGIRASSTPRQRVGAMLAIIAISAAMVPSHQLTPFALFFAVGGLVALDRTTPRGLPILIAALISAWMVFMATPYLTGHAEQHLQDVGAVGQNFSRGVAARVSGSAEHMFVFRMRIAMTFALGVLALAGAVRRLRHGHVDLSIAVLGITPFILIAIQGYGGEIFLRVYLFALPAMAFFAAALFFTDRDGGTQWRTIVTIGLVSTVLLTGMVLARFGNERAYVYTPREVEAVEHLYSMAEPDSLLIAGAQSLPWRNQQYATYRYERLRPAILRDTAVLATVQTMTRDPQQDAYLIITRSNKAFVDLFAEPEPGALDRFESALRVSPWFTIVYSNEDATIFVVSLPNDL